MWTLFESVITVPAVLGERFVVSGLVLISSLSAVNRPSALCEWMWIEFYRIHHSYNSMCCHAFIVIRSVSLVSGWGALQGLVRSLNCPLWRKRFSVCCGRFSKLGITLFCALRSWHFMSYSIGCVCAYRMHTHLRVFMSSHPPEIKLEWVCLRSNFHNRVCK